MRLAASLSFSRLCSMAQLCGQHTPAYVSIRRHASTRRLAASHTFSCLCSSVLARVYFVECSVDWCCIQERDRFHTHFHTYILFETTQKLEACLHDIHVYIYTYTVTPPLTPTQPRGFRGVSIRQRPVSVFHSRLPQL